MSVETDYPGWIGAAIKSLAAAVSAAFAWVWHTSHRQARVEGKVESILEWQNNSEKRQRRIEAGVNRILNHLTNTNLHDTDGHEE